jgi:membrane protein
VGEGGWRTGPLGLVDATIRKFLEDNCAQMAAAMSFYTFFSLPPLLFLLVVLAGTVLEPQVAQARLVAEIEAVIGPAGAEQVSAMIDAATGVEGRGIGTILGIGALVFGATAAFAQLQGSLNFAWRVQPDPARGDIRNFLVKRVFSFAMIISVVFLLLVSLAISALLSAFGELVGAALPAEVSGVLVTAAHESITFAVVVLIFATMYKVLPDARIAWKDVWIGAIVTALLFTLGKFAIGFQLGRIDPGTAYGAAGSLAVVLLWVYYSAMVLLIGAEFTAVWARWRGRPLVPEEGAVRIVVEKKALDSAQPAS